MKDKLKKLSLIFMVAILLTGCTKQLTTKNSTGKLENVTVEGFTLTANILCQPTNEKVIKAYEINKPVDKDGKKIDYKTLPKCEEFKVTSGGYEGLWTTIFVKPLAWFIVKIAVILKNIGLSGGIASGLALILATLIIRLVLLPFTKKTAMQSELLKQAQPELAKIEKKYQNAQDKETLMKKSQETMIVYKKYNINPTSSCLFAFIQLPLLIAFFEAINRIPLLFEGTFLGMKLGTTPLYGITHGQILYIILVIIIGLATFFSFKLNGGAASQPEMQSQMKIMSIVMVVIIIISSLNFSTAIAIYWITSSTMTIIQNLVVKKRRSSK